MAKRRRVQSADVRHGRDHDRPDDPRLRDRGAEGKHIPPIVRGEVRWCVGYSEPNAGSDLASLQTKCEDAGDHWLINGQKIVDVRRAVVGLVRLPRAHRPHRQEARRHQLHADRHAPAGDRDAADRADRRRLARSARPSSPTPTAPKDALLGQLNEGWTVGKRLLQHERASQTGAPWAAAGRRRCTRSPSATSSWTPKGRIADPDLRTRARPPPDGRQRPRPDAGARDGRVRRKPTARPTRASVLKNSATHVAQTRAELTLEIMGAPGPRLGGRELHARGDRGRPRLAVRQGDVDLRRLGRDPEQHHLQAHPGPAGHHPVDLTLRKRRKQESPRSLGSGAWTS